VLTDDELLDFDLTRLDGFETAPRTLLQRHGDLYRNHLVVARWLMRYHDDRSRRAVSAALGDRGTDFEKGALDSLRDIAAHLRQGDFLPGGRLYEDA
jgi:hypothetical protein